MTDLQLLGMVWGRRCGGHPCGNATLYKLNFALPRAGCVVDSVDDIVRIGGAGRYVDEHMVRDAMEVDTGYSGNGFQDSGELGFFTPAAGPAHRERQSLFGRRSGDSRKGQGQACE